MYKYDYTIKPDNIRSAAETMADVLFEHLNVSRDDPNFVSTPTRWVKYIAEFMQPFNPKDVLSKVFPLENDERDTHKPMVVMANIPFEAICAHHLVPVLGKAHVGYVPTDKAVGLSKLARLVHGISHRSPSLQEDVSNAIVDALVDHVDAAGAIAVIQAEHGCIACRGVARDGIITSTSSVRGVFRDVPQARAEFFELVKSSPTR